MSTGYSVFAVIQRDRSQPLALPRTEADQAAALLEAPDSLPDHSSSSATRATSTSEDTEQIVIPDDIDYDVANEDVELQAALAASLTGAGAEYGFEQHAYVPQAPLPVPAPELRRAPDPPRSQSRSQSGSNANANVDMDIDADADPVAASAARNRAMLEQMQRMQEAAFRETYDEDPAVAERRQQREREEADELERAIQESIREHGAGAGAGASEGTVTSGREETDNVPRSTGAETPRASTDPLQTQTQNHARVYDDEDAELQAALRASLQSMPEGYVHTTPPPQAAPSRPSAPAATQAQVQAPVNEKERMPSEASEGDESIETEGEGESVSSPPEPAKELDKDEIRRARLAKFGGTS